MVEPVKTSKEATDASVDQDFWGNTAKLVGISNSLKIFSKAESACTMLSEM